MQTVHLQKGRAGRGLGLPVAFGVEMQHAYGDPLTGDVPYSLQRACTGINADFLQYPNCSFLHLLRSHQRHRQWENRVPHQLFLAFLSPPSPFALFPGI